MKKTMVLAVFMFVAQLANATVGPALIDLIPQSVFPTLEARIKATAQQQIGVKSLKGFKVHWNDVKECIEARNEMNDQKLMGVCKVGFGAFQVQGEALVIVRENGYSTSVLYTNLE